MPVIATALPSATGAPPDGETRVSAPSYVSMSRLSVPGTKRQSSTRDSPPVRVTWVGSSLDCDSVSEAVNSTLARAPADPTSASVKV